MTTKPDHGSMKTIAISEFKARCLGLPEEVHAQGEELRLPSAARRSRESWRPNRPPSLEGSVISLVDDDELIAPLADWDAG